jgi:hypothetical protein
VALLFTAASSQYLLCTAPPLITFPITVGYWARLTAASTVVRTIFNLADTGVADHFISAGMSATEFPQVTGSAGTATTTGLTTTGYLAGGWTFVLARFLAANNRRLAAFSRGSAVCIDVTGNTTSRASANMDAMSIGALYTSAGASLFWDGDIAEFWIARGDPLLNVGTPQFWPMALALQGPFGIQGFADKIRCYRSFRTGLNSPEDFDVGAPFIWSAVNGPRLSSHPSLPYWYANRGQVQTKLVI